jgi:serine/threonine protein kinase
MESYGRYELIKKIATGGMAEIFLARQAGLEGFEKLLVLKRILPHLAENDEFVEMFLHEARVAVRLNHPNIVQIFDLGKENNAYYIAMEYIHGEDARRVWKQADAQKKPIPVPLVCRIVMDAAAGLDYAHKKTDPSGAPLHIIHRDVSPQNILVSFEGAVKVVDFGIAKAADQASQTRAGVLKGKYSYMSPEQAAGKDIDQRTDQFALGVVLWELLTARRLFKRNNDIQTLAAVTECKITQPWEIDPRVPKEVGAIALKAMARDPDQRFEDLHQMQVALEEWLLANRQSSGPSHLASYLADLYADRLSRERSEGVPVIGEGAEGSGSADHRSSRTDRRRAGISTADKAPKQTRDIKRGTRNDKLRAPAREPEEHTPEKSSITGSSVSRLVARLSERKRTAVWMAVVAALLGAGAVFVYQSQVGSTTRRNLGSEKPQPTTPVNAVGSVKLTTTPPGAAVLVDARPVPERTPTLVEGLALGEHTVRFELAGYKDQTATVTLTQEGEVGAAAVDLVRETALVKVTVESNPSGADLSMDGKPSGKTPATLELPAQASVELELTHDGYHAKKQQITVGETALKVAFELEKKAVVGLPANGPGALVVTCDPPATVWEAGKELGNTPLKVRLGAGRHQLVLANRQEGLEYAFSVVLKPDETATRTYHFDRGEVQVVVKPVTMDATIYLHNRKLGSNPLPKFSLLEGEYQLTVVNEELKKTKRVPVTVKKGEVSKVVVNLADD